MSKLLFHLLCVLVSFNIACANKQEGFFNMMSDDEDSTGFFPMNMNTNFNFFADKIKKQEAAAKKKKEAAQRKAAKVAAAQAAAAQAAKAAAQAAKAAAAKTAAATAAAAAAAQAKKAAAAKATAAESSRKKSPNEFCFNDNQCIPTKTKDGNQKARCQVTAARTMDGFDIKTQKKETGDSKKRCVGNYDKCDKRTQESSFAPPSARGMFGTVSMDLLLETNEKKVTSGGFGDTLVTSGGPVDEFDGCQKQWVSHRGCNSAHGGGSMSSNGQYCICNDKWTGKYCSCHAGICVPPQKIDCSEGKHKKKPVKAVMAGRFGSFMLGTAMDLFLETNEKNDKTNTVSGVAKHHDHSGIGPTCCEKDVFKECKYEFEQKQIDSSCGTCKSSKFDKIVCKKQCTIKQLNCKNGGTTQGEYSRKFVKSGEHETCNDYSSCSCTCKAGYTGRTCEISIPCTAGNRAAKFAKVVTGIVEHRFLAPNWQPCKNDGTSSGSDVLTNCHCNCPTTNKWIISGNLCENKAPIQCKVRDMWHQGNTNLNCAAGGTVMSILKEFKISGNLADENCKCVCKQNWAGPECRQKPKCDNDCENGGTMSGNIVDKNCQCSCKLGFKGKKCELMIPCLGSPNEPGPSCQDSLCQIGLKPNCWHGGKGTGFVAQNNCACDCTPGWTGATCRTKKVCTAQDMTCENSGKLIGNHIDSCKCLCTTVKLAGKNVAVFKGNRCQIPNECPACNNGGITTGTMSGVNLAHPVPNCGCKCQPQFTSTIEQPRCGAKRK